MLFIIIFGTLSFHIAGFGVGARQCLRFRTQNPSPIVVYFRAEMATFTFQYSLDRSNPNPNLNPHFDLLTPGSLHA